MNHLYISGKMTGIEDYNFPAFRAAAAQLRDAGYQVTDPSDKGIVEGWAWADYLEHDLVEIFACDGVATLDGWHHSRGARLEVHVAAELGMEIRSVREWLA